MPRIMRRTPATEEAMSYGFRDLMREIIGRTARETQEGFRRDPTKFSGEEMLELALSGLGGGVAKLTKAPAAVRGLMKRFSREGLRYDAFTEPLPGYGYHQWTLYGEGPAKGATFGTKTTELGEMEVKISELMRKFRKEPTSIRPSVPDPITGEPMTKFRVRPGGRHKWSVENPVQTKLDREFVEGRIQPGKWKAGIEKNEVTGYIIEGYNPKTGKWLWFNTEDTWLRAEQAVKRSEEYLKKRGK